MNLHEELGRIGADATAGSGSRLTSVEVADGLGARVRRGRRQRALGGAGVVAGVALIAVGVWSFAPLGDSGPVGPAGTSVDSTPRYELPDIKGATEYTVDGSARMSDNVPVDLRLPNELICGAAVNLAEGVTVHDPSVLSAGVQVSAASRSLLDDDTVVDDPDSIWVGYEAHHFETAVGWQDGAGISTTTVPLLMRSGEIVGIGVAEGAEGGGPGGSAESGPLWSPLPGDCANGAPSGALVDGTYQPVLATQVWSANLQTALATIVVSGGDLEYTGVPQMAGSDVPENLATAGSVMLAGGFTCPATLGAAEATAHDGVEDTSTAALAPIPGTLETGRLYGYGDDALVGGYPAPLGPDAGLAVEEFGREPARLVLSSGEDRWVFDAAWSERDDLPHDDAGWFVALSQVWDCGSPDLIPAGDYRARLIYSDSIEGEVGTAVMSDVTVVQGVPSIPELDPEG
ncbi:hypothetical protein [Demequina sp. NBRC 110055]|uniref:hypothetical protein n=1 Tax=Demequina sp. NBRC 110055 TaxID=1570344 RepID=UPI000A02C598|nr:hypothetical protein [Demequina sp. NBRC 110055]